MYIFLITIIFSFILIIFYFSNVEHFKSEHFKSGKNVIFGAKMDHLELAYKLCINNSNTKECRKFINNYENLRKSFHNLKKKYCKNNGKHCKELGI